MVFGLLDVVIVFFGFSSVFVYGGFDFFGGLVFWCIILLLVSFFS